MAITVSYSFEPVGSTFFFPNYANTSAWTQLDLVTRHDGGIAVVGNHGGSTEIDIYDSALNPPTQGDQSYAGTAPAIAEVAGGFIIVSTFSDTVNYTVVDADGTTFGTNLGFTVPGFAFSAADVTGTADGFVAAVQSRATGEDSAILLDFRGATSTTVVIDTSDDDTAPSICTLNDGGIAVAWTVGVGAGHTQVWDAVYEANGDERVAPQLLDAIGTVNRGVSVVALNNGGFAVAYEDNEFGDGKNHIAYDRLDANANLGNFVDITPGENATASQVSLTLLSNGWVAASYTLDYGGGDEDIRVRVFDPATDTVLTAFGDAEIDLHDSHNSSIAALNQGSMVLGWRDDSTGDEALQYNLVRTTTGKLHQANTLTGDSLIDRMTGGLKADTLDGGENDDALSGGGGQDTLIGGAGGDALTGGNGNDTASYAGAASLVTADLLNAAFNFGDAEGDTYTSIERLTGSDFDDFLNGNNAANTIAGGLGNDELVGRDGKDVLNGGGGNDHLRGGYGADTMNGGSGADTFHYSGAPESTGIGYDTIAGLNFDNDFMELPVGIVDTDGTIATGVLFTASFDTDLSGAVASLGQNHAIMFTPTSGDYVGHRFLVVDLNHKFGYQVHKDLVIDITGAAHLGSFGTGFFTTPPPGPLLAPHDDAAAVIVSAHIASALASAMAGHWFDHGAQHFLV